MIVESWAQVHRIVLNVVGRLKAGVGPGKALRALFPGGMITGCPKVRCTEIIAELEDSGRGAYTGSMGYLSRWGTLDTNILIRSLIQQERELTLRAGAEFAGATRARLIRCRAVRGRPVTECDIAPRSPSDFLAAVACHSVRGAITVASMAGHASAASQAMAKECAALLEETA